MRYARSTLFVAALAVAAFAMGRMTTPEYARAHTAAQPEDAIPPGMPAEMLAQMQAGTPGEGHEHLQPLVGEFAGTAKIWMAGMDEPFEIEATVRREWVLDGHYLREQVDSGNDMGEFHGLGYLGYNNMSGQYEFIWMDTDSTAIYSETGSYNTETGTFATRGTHRDPATGHIIASRGVVDVSDPDRQVYATYETGPDGKEHKSFEGVFKRK